MYTYTSDTIRYEYTRFYINDLMIYLIDWLRRSCWPRPGTDARQWIDKLCGSIGSNIPGRDHDVTRNTNGGFLK